MARNALLKILQLLNSCNSCSVTATCGSPSNFPTI
jgi:hypothetical protein